MRDWKLGLKRILCGVLTLAMCFGSLYIVPIVKAEDSNSQSETQAESEDIVVYEENFDKYTGDDAVSLTPVALDTVISSDAGVDCETGWVVKSNKSGENVTTTVKLEKGAMFVERTAGTYDIIYRDGGHTWGNYAYEADITYKVDASNWNTSTAPWFRLAFNIQENEDGTTRLFASSIKPGNRSDYRATYSFANTISWLSWNNTDTSENQLGVTYRHRIVVENNTVTSYYALYESDVLGEWKEAYKIEDIPEDMQTGSIGFIFGGGNGTFKIDNITVTETSSVVFQENFDNFENASLTAGDNTAYGLTFDQNHDSATAKIEDGRLYLSGYTFDKVYFNTGKNWTNYTVEADVCYTNNTGWVGLMFRSCATDDDTFWKASIGLDDGVDGNKSASVSLNGRLTGTGWYNDVSYNGTGNTTNFTKIATDTNVAVNDVVRYKVVVHENMAYLYAAFYDESGVLSDYQFMHAVSNKFAEAHMSGTIGIVTDNKAAGTTCWIDNVVISRGEDRIIEDPEQKNIVEVYVPETGIVNPPVVVQNLTDNLPDTSVALPAVMMMEIDSDLNILNSAGTSIATVDAYFTTYGTTVIPAFIVDSEVEAKAIATYLKKYNLIDAYIMASDDNVSCVKTARSIWSYAKGGLIFDTLGTTEEEWAAACKLANSDNLVTQLISKAPLSVEAMTYFNIHAIAAWSYANDTENVYNAITSGYHSVVTDTPSLVYGIYEGITETTVSGRPLAIAHRGSTITCSENTLEAFQEALDYGCMAVETDLRISKDGEIVLNHNSWLSDTTDIMSNAVLHSDNSSYVKDYTVEELKQLTVTTGTVTGKIPTFAEALETFEDTGLVFYAHINDATTLNRFNEILTEHPEYVDNVIVFYGIDGIRTAYNSELLTVPVAITVAHGSQTSGEVAESILAETDVDTLKGFIKLMNPWNANPLFYNYGTHATEEFYYEMAAHGFVNIHTVTNGQDNLNERLLTTQGAVSALTDNVNLTDDYHYLVDVSNTNAELKVGKAINLTHDVKTVAGKVSSVKCGFTQISGPELEYSSKVKGYTASEAGEVVLVYYADLQASGGATYRVYSEPVTLTFTGEGPSVTVLPSIEQDAGKSNRITSGYSENDSYVVLSARLKALDAITYDWNSNIVVSVSGTNNWNNYGFQILYGQSSEQNLIKLNGSSSAAIGAGTSNGITVKQEQWVNNSKLEKLFADEGLEIKVIRFDTWAFLLADMGDGYEMIGKMLLPADALTQFTLYNRNTEVRMSKITVETGKDAVLDALGGIDLSVNSQMYYLPMDSSTWTLEGKLTLDKNAIEALTGDYRVYVGNKQIWNSTGAAILCVGDTNLWRGQELATWKSKTIPTGYVNLLNQANGGLWVRWVRQGNLLSLWASADHEKWYPLVQDIGLVDSALGLYLQSAGGACDATLNDIRLSLESEYPEVLEQETTSADILTIPGDYSSEKFAVLEATIKAPDGYTNAWANNVILSSTGTAKWDGYDMQILFGDNVSKNCVKTDKAQAAYDGITIDQTQWVNRSEFMNLFSTGLKIQLVRLNTWTYLLVDMGSGYELVGRVHTPEAEVTSFGIYNDKTKVIITDWSVKTGKENTLVAMDGMKLDLTTTAYSFPVDSENWTLEGRITYVQSTFDSLRNGANYHVLAGTNLSTAYMSACWLAAKTEGNNNTYGVTALRGMTDSNLITFSHWMRDNNEASGGGMWTRWVREGDALTVYASPDRVTWKKLTLSSEIDAGAAGIYLKESVDIDSWISNVTIRTSVGDATYKDMESDSIRVATNPTKLSYYEGDKFEAAGMKVQLMKGTEVVKTVPLDECEIAPNRELTTEDTKITVTYRGFSVEVPITVTEKLVTKVAIKDLPYWTEYNVGDTVNLSGATYLATYNNGDLVEYTIEKSMCTTVDTSVSGTKNVTATVPFNGDSRALTFAVCVIGKDAECETIVLCYTASQANQYLAGDNSYPTKNGYLFAGWYTTHEIPEDEEVAVQYSVEDSVPSDVDVVYALFVPNHVLSIKAQVSAHLIDGIADLDETSPTYDKKGSIRFVTSVDSLLYKEVGFEVSYVGADGKVKTATSASNKVYRALYETGTNKKVWEKTPKDLFCDASEFFKACTVTGVPENMYGTQFTVKPYWITLSGDKVYGVEATKSIQEGIDKSVKKTDVYVSSTAENAVDSVWAGSAACPYATLNFAIACVDNGGTIHVKDSYAVTSDFKWESHGKSVTITDGKLDFSAQKDVCINDAVTFSNIELTLSSTENTRLFAEGNKLVVESDVIFTNPNVYVQVLGGSLTKEVASTHVELYAGNYNRVYGGGPGQSVTGDTYVKVGASVNKDLAFRTHTDTHCLYGGCYSGTVGGNTNVIVEGASFHYVYGGGESSTSVVEGSTNVNFAGKAMSVYGGSKKGNCAQTHVIMTGGEVEQIFGGNKEASMTGNTDVQVLGGTVYRRIYGGCYNNFVEDGLGGSWEDTKYHVTGQVSVMIGENANLLMNYTKEVLGSISIKADDSLIAASRWSTMFENEIGVMIFNDGLYAENSDKIGYQGDTHNSYFTKHNYDYLVKASAGGKVYAEENGLRIVPSNTENENYTVTVTVDGEVVEFTGDYYELPALNEARDSKVIVVTFTKN